MGARGPIGKRSDQRVRRNKEGEDGLAVEKVSMVGSVEQPALNLGVENLHPLVEDFWDSLAESGQAKYYEPSDWQYARFVLAAVNELLTANSGMSAMKLSAVDGMLARLLITEGDRRRVKLEVEREQQQAQLFDAAAEFRRRMEQAN